MLCNVCAMDNGDSRKRIRFAQLAVIFASLSLCRRGRCGPLRGRAPPIHPTLLRRARTPRDAAPPPRCALPPQCCWVLKLNRC